MTPRFSAMWSCSTGESVRASCIRSGGGNERMADTCDGVWKVWCGSPTDGGGRTGKVGSGIESALRAGADATLERLVVVGGMWTGGCCMLLVEAAAVEAEDAELPPTCPAPAAAVADD